MQYLWSVLTQILMYLSAIFYSVDSFSPNVRNMYYLNPIYLFIRYFRSVVIDGAIPPLWFHVLIAIYSMAALGIGIIIYKKYDTEFLYYI